MESIKLSPGQVAAYDAIMQWHKGDSQVFVLAGYAGTGKSTMASRITDEIGADNVYYCAYTGKAANVLREKGCDNVNTLHGWLYDPREHNKRVIAELQEAIDVATLNGDMVEVANLKDQLAARREEEKKPRWALNTESELKRADLVIVDEYSMLNDKIISDLLQVAKKVLFLGDPYQLPPVEGECSLAPDAFLEEIHRQALDSAIIMYSKIIREGGSIPMGRHGDLDFVHKRELGKQFYLDVDQLIVGKNATRIAMNDWYRRQLGYTSLYPDAGEKMICLKNNHARGLFNGMIGTARTKAKYAGHLYHFEFEDMESVKVFTGDVTGEGHKYDYRNPAHKELERFTYGYAITCHKSQGSEFEKLAVVNEPIGRGEDRKRWTYTAITRAKQHCTLINAK